MQTPNDLIRAYQRRAKKRYGQHFLSDPSILERVADAADVAEGDAVLEIGPGPGTLTWALLARGARVRAVEIDGDAVAFLRELYAERDAFALTEGDALEVEFGPILAEFPRWKCVSNLPYNVGTPIFFKLTEHAACFDVMALMFQREVAQRMVATPEQRADYGILSLMTQLHHDAEIAMTLPPGAFSPPPKVHSAVVRLTPVPGTRIPDAAERALFERVIKAAFQQRRKTLPNGLKGAGFAKAVSREAMEQVGIDARARPEVIDFDGFVALTRALRERQK